MDAYRALQPQAQLPTGPPHLPHHTLASQSGTLDLAALDPSNAVFEEQFRHLQAQAGAFQSANAFDNVNLGAHRQLIPQPHGSPHAPQQNHNAGQFGIMTPAQVQHNAIARLQQENSVNNVFDTPEPQVNEDKSDSHLATKLVVDPPDLEEWRNRLFHVDDIIYLSEEQFQTYFPHVDNVYSHRSTQRYKRKPFMSHYWDCRLKGRPPGTPKSDDPTKRKRKRTARERDLCDVKIKITEYYPGAALQPDFVPDGGGTPGANAFFPSQPSTTQGAPFGVLQVNLPPNHPGATGQRFYTIQRVNGNGGNGKGDGVAGPHKHTLEESDRVKKNSVQRHLAKQEKEVKKTQKTYHKRASGNALNTVKKHSKDNELKLFGSCFCPFVQRVWIALEAKGMHYQYIEVDPYKKPQALLEVNPRGLVPGIRHGDWGCGESTVLMEYLEDLGYGNPLLPTGNPQLRATSRLWADHINRNIVPAFYQLLQAQDIEKQAEFTQKLKEEISKLVDACDPSGPFFLGPQMTYVDVQFAPWMLRCSRVLSPYRGWPNPEPGSRWARWVDAIEADEHVRATTSLDELYKDSYERYAHNRPNTSQLADAINGGFSLP